MVRTALANGAKVMTIPSTDVADSTKSGRLPPKVYLVAALTQGALGLHSSMLNSYIIDMGATYAEIGSFRSVGNIAPTFLQPAWGAISDKIGRNKHFVAFGTLTGLFMVLLFLWAETPIHMIALYGVQSILFSIQIPTWLSLIGGLMDEDKRGTELSRLNLVASVASMMATVVAGILAVSPAILPFLRAILGDLGTVVFPPVESWREAYYLPFYFTAIFGIISSIIALTIKEKEVDRSKEREYPPLLRLLSQPGDFRQFCFIAIFFSFAMSMAWPYFTVVQRIWLENSLLEITLASAIMTLSTIIFTIPFGYLSDKVGRKPLIVLGRGLLFLVPLMYAFATNVYIIYIANALAGFSVAATVNSITAYIYDVAPKEERGSHIAVYNTFTGIILLFGSLISGFIGDALALQIGGYLAVFWMLIISATLRFIGSFFFLLIKEPREYESTLWRELRSLVSPRRHDVDRV